MRVASWGFGHQVRSTVWCRCVNIDIGKSGREQEAVLGGFRKKAQGPKVCNEICYQWVFTRLKNKMTRRFSFFWLSTANYRVSIISPF